MKALLIVVVGLVLAAAVAPTASAEPLYPPETPEWPPECTYHYYDWETPVGTVRMPDHIECRW